MNRREANDLREVLTMLEHGPGQGWRELLADCGAAGDGKGTDLRLADFNLWRDTWIRPALRRLVDRYWRASRRAPRALAPGGVRPSSERLRATLREGEAREARGVEESPYWIGYYKGIAMSAIERLEELERALVAATGVERAR